MRQFFKMFFASLLAMVVAAVLVVVIMLGLAIKAVNSATKPQKAEAVSRKSVLRIDLSERLREQHETNSFAKFSESNNFEAGLYDATEAIRAAADDDDIACIYLKADGSPNSFASMQQLRAALLDFKKSKKPIYAYGEQISQRDYYLCSVADSVFLNPVGGVELKGLAAELEFYKGTLDKLGVAPKIFYCGKFKSATEPYRTDKASEPNREQLTRLLSGVWVDIADAVAAKTGADTGAVNRWANSLAANMPADALRLRLVDGLRYADEVDSVLKRAMKLDKDDKLPTVTLDAYAEQVYDDHDRSGDRIALLLAEGEIVDGKGSDYQIASEPMVKTIRDLEKNDRIKAVVLRVNSPGGSALASEVILRELQLLRRRKPVIVSMGDVAASGGYYISCAADSVFAMPGTITGSIGVFAMLFNIAPAAKDKLGVTFDQVKTHEHADFPTATRDFTAYEDTLMQRQVDAIYLTFKRHVAAARRMDLAMVDSIAQGRVWVGRDALALGLVDGLGGLDRAILAAATKAGLKTYSVVTYPEPVDKFAAMLRRFKGSPLSSMLAGAALAELSKPVADGMTRLQWLQKTAGTPMMVMPAEIRIR